MSAGGASGDGTGFCSSTTSRLSIALFSEAMHLLAYTKGTRGARGRIACKRQQYCMRFRKFVPSEDTDEPIQEAAE
jgi:hypothetical protein